ncbi:MAG: YIP1 family protein [Terracidiphilus sp.]|jgi:hypothetical protein
MSEIEVPSVAGTTGLSQWQRVAFTFTAPSKTFEDIKRGNRSWWLPLILVSLVGYLFFAVVATQVGIHQTVENQTHLSAKAAEGMANATPEQREKALSFWVTFSEVLFIANPAITLGWYALLSLGLMGTINFGFGGRAKFGSVLAVWLYSLLPVMIIKPLLGSVVIFASGAPESFNIKNFAPTNVGAFLNPLETNTAVYALLTSLDVMQIWSLVLLAIGTAAVAGVKRSSGYIAVFGWWVIIVLFGVGIAAVAG